MEERKEISWVKEKKEKRYAATKERKTERKAGV